MNLTWKQRRGLQKALEGGNLTRPALVGCFSMATGSSAEAIESLRQAGNWWKDHPDQRCWVNRAGYRRL